MRRWVLLLILLLVALACGGLGSDAPEEVAPVDVPAIPAPITPPTPPAPVAEPPAQPTMLTKDADPIAAFTADCAATFTVADSESDVMVSECAFIEFDQMCAEDPFGCWDKGEGCRSGCDEPCTTCQTDCTAGCTDCKTQCDGDADCIRQCAEARQACREGCLGGLETCKDITCGEVEEDCGKQAELTKRRTCPRCDEIRSCILDSYDDGTFAEDPCRAKIKAEEQCYTWCHPGW